MLKLTTDQDHEDPNEVKGILFWIPTHNDIYRLANVLDSIHKVYKNPNVVVFSDREALPDCTKRLCRRFGVNLVQVKSDFHYGHISRMRVYHSEWLEYFLKTDCDWFIKLDTDSVVFRKVKNLPEKCLFGNMTHDKQHDVPFIQGGVYGMDRWTAKEILDRGPFEDLPLWTLNRKRHFWAEDKTMTFLARRANVEISSCSDFSFDKGHPSIHHFNFVDNFDYSKGIAILEREGIGMYNFDLFGPLLDLIKDISPHFDYMPNVGNWGDAMISAGAEILFAKRQFVYTKVDKPREGKLLVYGGGGSWCHYFNHGKVSCMNASKSYENIVVLPSSYDREMEVPSNITLTARDNASLEKVDSPLPAIPDLAFALPQLTTQKLFSNLNAWRTNKDRHPDRPEIPSDNIDISKCASHKRTVEPLLHFVGQFEEVDTDRMHIGIAAAIQKVEKLTLRPNGYHKLKSSFDTFPELYPENTEFLEWS
jgi:hypothetical protein